MKSLLAASAALMIAASVAGAATFTVQGTDAVYGAGLPGYGPSTAPESIALPGGTGLYVSFSGVTGTTGCCSEGGPVYPYGPDGGGGGTNVTALNGLSGIIASSQMFLAGVFISSITPPVPGSQPASLDYTGAGATTAATYLPLLNQVFFIGDGLAGALTQKFFAPTGATTLLLGFVDSYGFNGAPSYYSDNPGQLTGSYSFTVRNPGTNIVPLPAGLPLLLTGFAALGLLRRKRG